jgi:CheY-like chemotaxis protein
MTLHILAVDDDATNRRVMAQALTAFGHAVETAEDGHAALEMLAARPFDLVLLDIHMPQLSGVDVLELLRTREGPNRFTPALCITADLLTRRPSEYVELGFEEFLAKPVQLAKLAATIDRVAAVGQEQQQRDRLKAKLAALHRRAAGG